MTTLFSAALGRMGLSQLEAAEYFEVRLDTVKSWGAARNPVPDGVWQQLHRLADRQHAAAAAIVASWREQGEPDQIEAALPSDAEIRRRGWPSRGAFIAVFTAAWAMLPPNVRVRIVPAGPTPAVRAAERVRTIAGG